MYETIVRHCVSICEKRVGDGCFYRREKIKNVSSFGLVLFRLNQVAGLVPSSYFYLMGDNGGKLFVRHW